MKELAELAQSWRVTIEKRVVIVTAHFTSDVFRYKYDGTERGLGIAIGRAWAGEKGDE